MAVSRWKLYTWKKMSTFKEASTWFCFVRVGCQCKECQCIVSVKVCHIYIYTYIYNEGAVVFDCLWACRVCSNKMGKRTFGKKCDIPCHLVTLFLPIPTSLNMKHFVKPLQRCGIQVICMSRRFATRVLFWLLTSK